MRAYEGAKAAQRCWQRRGQEGRLQVPIACVRPKPSQARAYNFVNFRNAAGWTPAQRFPVMRSMKSIVQAVCAASRVVATLAIE